MPMRRIRMGADLQKQPRDSRDGGVSWPLGRGWGRRNGDWIHLCGQWFDQSQLCNEIPNKNSGHQAQQSFQVCKHMGLPRMGPYPDPSGRGHRSCVQNPSIPCCMCLSIWLALICSLIMIIINWKSKYRMFLSSMSLSNKLLNLREVVGTIWLCSHLVRSVGGLGSLEVQLASEMRAIFWGIGSLHLWGLMLTLDGQYQNEIAVLQVGTK